MNQENLDEENYNSGLLQDYLNEENYNPGFLQLLEANPQMNEDSAAAEQFLASLPQNPENNDDAVRAAASAAARAIRRQRLLQKQHYKDLRTIIEERQANRQNNKREVTSECSAAGKALRACSKGRKGIPNKATILKRQAAQNIIIAASADNGGIAGIVPNVFH